VTSPQNETVAPPARGDDRSPDPAEQPEPASDAGEAPDEADDRSLLADVEALIDDGKTYIEAELAYQRTRAAYVADGAKGAAILFAAAAMLGFLALIGLTVGLIISLAPILTAWGASALVVGALILGALMAGRAAAGRWSRLMAAIESKPEQKP
jgi:hypothetical protein